MGKLDRLQATGDGGRASAGARPEGVARRPLLDIQTLPPDAQLRPDGNFGWLPVDAIVPDPNQPRREWKDEDLQPLVDSLRGPHGQLQPIRVRWVPELAKWMIVAGERRWRAARKALLRALACVRVEGAADPGWVLEEQLIENLIRTDLNPRDRALAMRGLMERNGWYPAELARALCLSPATVSRYLTISEAGEAVQEALAAGEVTEREAYQAARKPPEEQPAAVLKIRQEREKRSAPAARVKRSESFHGDGIRATVTAESALTDALLESFLHDVLAQVRARQEPRRAA